MSNNASTRTYKLYDRLYVAILSFITSPAFGGIVIAINYYRLGEKSNFKRSLLISLMLIVMQLYMLITYASDDEMRFSGDYPALNLFSFGGLFGSFFTASRYYEFQYVILSSCLVFYIQTILQGKQLIKHSRNRGGFVSLWFLVLIFFLVLALFHSILQYYSG